MKDKITLQGIGDFKTWTIPSELIAQERQRIEMRKKQLKSWFNQHKDENNKIDINQALDFIAMAENYVLFQTTKHADLPHELSEIFVSLSEYERIVELMKKHRWVNNDKKWIEKSNGKKSLFAWFLKVLEQKNYLNTKLTPETIVIIALNDFHLKISKDAVKKIGVSDLHNTSCPFYEHL